MLKENKNIVDENGNEINGGIGESPKENTDNTKNEALPPTDFKIAEIWLRNGQIMLDASEAFWSDRVRAVGVMDLCKDIVKNAQVAPEKKEKKSKIVLPDPRVNLKNFVAGLRKRK